MKQWNKVKGVEGLYRNANGKYYARFSNKKNQYSAEPLLASLFAIGKCCSIQLKKVFYFSIPEEANLLILILCNSQKSAKGICDKYT